MARMDLGRKMTDKELLALENKIRKEYTEAEKDLRAKMDDYFRRFRIKDEIKRDQVRRGVITATEYKQWRTGQIAVGKRWQALVDSIADDLDNVEKIAKAVANGYLPSIYVINMNFSTYDIEKKLRMDTSFVLYDTDTVARILRDDPELLPPPGIRMRRRIASGEVKRWRKGQIQSVVLQALLQGESIPNMASRIARDLCVADRKSAIRYARTAVTGAENAGRMDSYRRMEGLGVKMQKTWLATLDGRTREAHRELDGQTIPVSEPFVNSIGEIMSPGDPDASPGNIWNCRCTMVSQIAGFERDVADLSLRNVTKLGDMSYEEWRNEKMKSQNILMPDIVANIMRNRYRRDYRR